MGDEGAALDPGVGELALLLAVEHVPPPAAEGEVELPDELGVDEVDEGVAHVALVVVVDRQVEEVGPVLEGLLDLLLQHLLAVLVGNVADHQRRPRVALDLLQVYLVAAGFLSVALALLGLVGSVLVVHIRIVVGWVIGIRGLLGRRRKRVRKGRFLLLGSECAPGAACFRLCEVVRLASDRLLFVRGMLERLVGILGVEDLAHLLVLDFLARSLEAQLLLAADGRKVHVVDELGDLLRVGVVQHLAHHARQEILILKLHLLLSFHCYFGAGRDNSGAGWRLPLFVDGLRPDEALEVV